MPLRPELSRRGATARRHGPALHRPVRRLRPGARADDARPARGRSRSRSAGRRARATRRSTRRRPPGRSAPAPSRCASRSPPAATRWAALESGAATIAVASEPELLAARDRGARLVAIGALVDRPLDGIVSLAARPVASVAAARRPHRRDDRARARRRPARDRARRRARLAHARAHPHHPVRPEPAAQLGPGDRARSAARGRSSWRQLAAAHHPARALTLPDAGVPTYSGLVVVVRVGEAHDDGPLLRAFLQSLTRGQRALAANPAAAAAVLATAQPADRRARRARRDRERPLDRRPAAAPSTPTATRTPGNGRPSAAGWRGHGLLAHAPNGAAGDHRRVPAGTGRVGPPHRAQRVGRGEPAPRLVGREELAHLVLLRAGARVAGAQPPDELAQPEVAGGDLVEAALAVQREALDGPGADARQRAQPPPGPLVVGTRAGRRGRARPRARRGAASARGPARGRRTRAAPARSPASAAALGRSRSSVCRRRARPSARTIRRSIPAAREYSISCSQIAHASASNGSGRRVGRSHGVRRTTGADQRVVAEARVERREVVVDAEREAHALERRPRSAPFERAPRADQDRPRDALRRAHAARARPSTCSRRSSTPPRERITPSAPPPGSRSGQRGVSSTRRSQMPAEITHGAALKRASRTRRAVSAA